MDTHPVRLRLEDDLRRSRLTVLFRVLLALPHVVWFWLWSQLAQMLAIVGWFIALATGRIPDWLHEFLASYLRYTAHLLAYLTLAADPYPGFAGAAGSYPVDAEIPPPAPQSRWRTFFRLPLVLPAALLLGALWFRVLSVAVFLGWFSALARGRMPRGLRDAAAYGVGYATQVNAYLLLVTDRYPSTDPDRVGPRWELPEHPVALTLDSSMRRSRLTVLFRFLLSFPHFVWLLLWSVPALLAVIVQWLITLIRGRPAALLHRFLVAFIRYSSHVFAFLFLVANPFPGFTGARGYPLDVTMPGPERQNRWKTAFRSVLVVPAFLLASGLSYVLYMIAFLAWFAALFTGRMPTGLRNLGAISIRYTTQTYAYWFLITDRYPYASPALRAPEVELEPAAELHGEVAA